MEPAEAIESLAKPTKENKERVEEVREAIEGFARACSASPGYRRVAEELGRALERLYGSSPAEQEVIFAQSALALFLSALFYELERSRHDLKPLRELLEEKGLPEGFREAMRELGRRGYEMAEVAGELLAPLPPELAPILRKIVETAERSAGESSLLSHDLAGRIFHAIAGDIALRKGLATYYTETPAAYLLAWLAARELALTEAGGTTAAEALEAARRLSSARVADFACGSGTLLVAAHYALSQLSRLLCSPHQISCPEVEVDKIYGLDAQKYAAQIAAMNLSFLAGRPARHVYSVPFGYLPGKGALLGSLELLDESPALSAVREAPLARSHRIELELPGEFDIVIMNPPFTRATGRTKRRFAGSRRDFFGFLAELERRALTRRYNELQRKVREELSRIAEELFQRGQVSPPMLQGKGRRGYCDISRAGEGLPFLYLAYRYVKPGGVIAFVLPRNLLAGTSWFLARALLAHKFHLKYVIVSSDGERGYNFSESTSLSECLVVARRVEEHSPEEETVFVNFYRKPQGVLEALLRAEEIARGRAEGAAVFKAKRGELLKNIDNLNRFAALPEDSTLSIALKVLEGDLGIVKVPVTRLGELVESMGIHSTLFHQLFHVERGEPKQYPLLYGGEEGNRLRMLARPNAEGRPRSRRAAELFSRLSARLLLPDRVWLDTAHVIAVFSEKPLLSNVFHPVRLRGGEEAEKALALWLNTTWGLLAYLVSREETRGRWMRLTQTQWKLLPVLDTKALESRLARLAEAFDRVAEREPKRIPQQFRGDEVRTEIDLAFLEAMGVSRSEAIPKLAELYRAVDLAFRRWIS